ncbi:MAG: DNA starvation/stationary phase protection protein [Rhodobacteraceae bacterium]|nr:DNA starvation/stationary phase protection protein [Paracoccaceae bacterium]
MASVASKLETAAVEEIVNGLTQGLAETAVETMKAQNFHWNVTGMAFGPLHELFQKMYEDHFTAQDDLGERIKALEAHAEGRHSEYLKRSAVAESDGKIAAEAMIKELAADQEIISATMRDLAALADKHGDVVTNDMAIERAQTHDKFAWLLRAHLG